VKFRVDLRSDTVSFPDHKMRQAMAHAEVGDDVFGEDPTINALEARTAKLLGFPAALFLPSGTMSNGVAIRTLARPGEEVICGSRTHTYLYEGAQFALNGGIQMHRIDEEPTGLLPPDQVSSALSRKGDLHFAGRTVLSLENTHNVLGGRILPDRGVEELKSIASGHGVRLYLDGARLWHVPVAGGKSLRDLADGFDMVSVCFSKAMGCPVGSVLAGSRDLVDRARWLRKRMGGVMRQSGVLAAACIYALDNNLEKLPMTHRWASRLARAAGTSPVLNVDMEQVETNIVMLDTPEDTARSTVSALDAMGIGSLAVGPSRIRLVTHLSLSEKDVQYAADTLAVFGG
jgi:threonine aldolase